jgi:hypothetical protein
VATYVPSFPIYPPEFSWMRTPHTDRPALTVREDPAGGRVVYVAADLDRCYGRLGLPDHGDVLAGAVRWAARDTFPFRVTGPGYVDARLYRQTDRLVLHLVNLNGAGMWPGYLEEHLPIGPYHVTVRLPEGLDLRRVRCRVSGATPAPVHEAGTLSFELNALTLHEVVVIE